MSGRKSSLTATKSTTPVAEEFTLCCSTAKKTLVLSEQAKEIGLKTEISDSYQDKLLIDSLKE